jgi:hypothetical protein
MFYEKSKKYDYLANEIFGVMKELEKKWFKTTFAITLELFHYLCFL